MIPSYNPHEIEKEVLKYWEENNVYQKTKQIRKKGNKFYFLQGPPYTSGRLHIGHAWNHACKDIMLRYKRLKGFDVWDRGGYDMHGLPTENKVQKDLKLATKKDIEKYGVEKFISKCREFCIEMAKQMDKDLWRMGVWLDNEHAYYPITNDYIEGEWLAIKKGFEQKRLYKGKMAITWCAECETALAKHELEYETDKDMSIFLKFKIKDSKNEYLIIWTTTPWTIPFNMAVMVNPDLEYVKAKVDDEVWIIAAPLVNVLLGMLGKTYKIIETIKGSSLEGIYYIHPMHDMVPAFKELKEKHPKLHSVVLSSEYVDASAGSGLVHCAPGCGPEDYEVGQENNLPPFNNLDERGVFRDMGELSGMTAKVDDDKFIEILDKKGCLIMKTPVEHEYAHCWRCHKPVVFRTTTQWFMRTEDLKERMVQDNSKVNWVPDNCGKSYATWLSNLRDNSITRQRYWGCPVPIWECSSCGKVTIIGSTKELKKLSVDGKVPEDLHKPWIDEVKIKCSCGNIVSRIPDVLDVWIDSASASWNCLYYPKETKYFKKYFPADFICEAHEQTRLWFSMLTIYSYIMFDKPCFENVYTTGMIFDFQGMKMSKSLGNIISPYEVMDKYGADVLRNYFALQKAGVNMNFSWEDVKQVQRNIGVLWNLHKLVIDLAKTNNINPLKLKDSDISNDLEENYILSRMHSTIKKVTELYDKYEIDEAQEPAISFFLAISRDYVQAVREKVSMGTDVEKRTVIKTLFETTYNAIRLLSPVIPFTTEKIYLNFKEAFGLKEGSIFYLDWPEYDEDMIDEGLEKDFVKAFDVIQAALNAREKAKINVRWPLKEMLIVTEDNDLKEAVLDLEKIIKQLVNVKEIQFVKEVQKKDVVRADYAKLNPEYKQKTPLIIAQLAMTPAHVILKNIEEKGEHIVTVDNEKFSVRKEHLMIEAIMQEGYVRTDMSKGYLVLNTNMDEILKSEGFTREVTRRIQQARKEAGLQKKDLIDITIKCDTQLQKYLEMNITYFKEKIGAKNIKFGEEKKESRAKDKVKDKEFEVWF